jgi:type I restriction enzyme S subunit
MTGSSGRQRVPAEALSHFKVAVPSAEIATEFGKLVSPLIARASAAVKQSRILRALRDTLLPKLISGELRLADPKRFLGGQM